MLWQSVCFGRYAKFPFFKFTFFLGLRGCIKGEGLKAMEVQELVILFSCLFALTTRSLCSSFICFSDTWCFQNHGFFYDLREEGKNMEIGNRK
jgi:hypothetical protein